MARTSSSSFAALLVAFLVWAAPASALPGPPLTEPAEELDAALTCAPSTDRPPVLLVHGTGGTVQENFETNYKRFLTDAGLQWCAVQIPNRGVGDMQENVQYVVHAIRRLYPVRHERIDIIGHSQGGTLPMLALKFWPDLALKVDDVITFSGAFDMGTTGANLLCATAATCTPAFAEYKPGSRFLQGFAAQPLPPGPSYTSFATRLDEIVTPAPQASHLNAPGAANYVLQDLCPSDIAEHLTIITEQPLLQLALDALDHPGPADAGRTGALTCGFVPDAAVEFTFGLPTFLAGVLAASAGNSGATDPKLECYIDVDCKKPLLAPRLKATVGRRAVTGRLILPPGALNQCAGTVAVKGSHGQITQNCRFTVKVKARGKRVDVRFLGNDELLPVTIRPK